MGLAAAVVVALVALAVPAVAVWYVWSSTRPERPRPGPPAIELGPETPALVDLLTGGFAVDDDAVPATAVDLAARGWLDIEEIGGAVRLRPRTGSGDLTRYEHRVLRHVESKSIDGVAPAAVLTIGPAGASERWWRGFVREVNRHGRDLGLCRRRYHVRHLAVAWAGIAVGWVSAMAVGSGSRGSEPDRDGDALVGLIASVTWVGVLGLTYLAGRMTRSDAQAETDAGMHAASRWLGVRAQMAAADSFGRAPAASVAIWDRNLAYATAMGLAPVVLRQLPFETEHDRHAWSRATGQWRRVDVRYLALRPAWGQSPWSTAISGAVQAAFLGLLAGGGYLVADDRLDLTSLPEPNQRIARLAGLVVAGVAASGALYALLKFTLGVLDLFPRRTIEGEVVRRRELKTGHRLPRIVQWLMWSGQDEHGERREHRRRTRHHIAVDDGSDDSIVAHQVRPQLFRSVGQGARVRMKVSPLLGYVTEITLLSPPPRREPAVAHELVEDVAGRATAALGGVFGRLGLDTDGGDDGRPSDPAR